MPLKIKKLKQREDVYDITVEHNHNFYANGVLVHNCEITLPTNPLESINSGATMQRVRVHRSKIAEFKEYREANNGILYGDTDLYELAEDFNPDFEYFNALVADGEGGAEISICSLSAINLGKFRRKEDMQKPCELAVRALDEMLDFQNYPVIAAEVSTMRRRPLGIGLINLAYWMVKHDMTYSRPKLKLLDEWMEAWSYYLIDASAKLAEEKGACLYSHQTKYADGIVPMDTRKKDVDDLVRYEERMPWDDLRARLKEHGIRNSTLMAIMPAETSAQTSNSTNGIEPPRGLVSVKQSKHGILKQAVPECSRLKNKYELLWDQKNNNGNMKIAAVVQKYCDQAMSVNSNYNPEHYKDGKVPMSTLLSDLMTAYKFGLKTLYYCNTYDGAGEMNVEDAVEKNIGHPASDDSNIDDDCDSCKL